MRAAISSSLRLFFFSACFLLLEPVERARGICNLESICSILVFIHFLNFYFYFFVQALLNIFLFISHLVVRQISLRVTSHQIIGWHISCSLLIKSSIESRFHIVGRGGGSCSWKSLKFQLISNPIFNNIVISWTKKWWTTRHECHVYATHWSLTASSWRRTINNVNAMIREKYENSNRTSRAHTHTQKKEVRSFRLAENRTQWQMDETHSFKTGEFD